MFDWEKRRRRRELFISLNSSVIRMKNAQSNGCERWCVFVCYGQSFHINVTKIKHFGYSNWFDAKRKKNHLDIEKKEEKQTDARKKKLEEKRKSSVWIFELTIAVNMINSWKSPWVFVKEKFPVYSRLMNENWEQQTYTHTHKRRRTTCGCVYEW